MYSSFTPRKRSISRWKKSCSFRFARTAARITSAKPLEAIALNPIVKPIAHGVRNQTPRDCQRAPRLRHRAGGGERAGPPGVRNAVAQHHERVEDFRIKTIVTVKSTRQRVLNDGKAARAGRIAVQHPLDTRRAEYAKNREKCTLWM